jgi:hypothetical protein
MKKFVIGLAALPFLASIAAAGEPLTNQQMDQVTAGFTSLAIADAQALGTVVLSGTATLSQVVPVASATYGEVSFTLYKSLAGSQSASATSGLPTISLTSCLCFSANP